MSLHKALRDFQKSPEAKRHHRSQNQQHYDNHNLTTRRHTSDSEQQLNNRRVQRPGSESEDLDPHYTTIPEEFKLQHRSQNQHSVSDSKASRQAIRPPAAMMQQQQKQQQQQQRTQYSNGFTQHERNTQHNTHSSHNSNSLDRRNYNSNSLDRKTYLSPLPVHPLSSPKTVNGNSHRWSRGSSRSSNSSDEQGAGNGYYSAQLSMYKTSQENLDAQSTYSGEYAQIHSPTSPTSPTVPVSPVIPTSPLMKSRLEYERTRSLGRHNSSSAIDGRQRSAHEVLRTQSLSRQRSAGEAEARTYNIVGNIGGKRTASDSDAGNTGSLDRRRQRGRGTSRRRSPSPAQGYFAALNMRSPTGSLDRRNIDTRRHFRYESNPELKSMDGNTYTRSPSNDRESGTPKLNRSYIAAFKVRT